MLQLNSSLQLGTFYFLCPFQMAFGIVYSKVKALLQKIPFAESPDGNEGPDNPYSVSVEDKDGDLHIHRNPCGARATLWLSSEVYTKGK